MAIRLHSGTKSPYSDIRENQYQSLFPSSVLDSEQNYLDKQCSVVVNRAVDDP